MWKYCEVRGKVNQSKSKVTDNDQEKANIFSKYFMSVQIEETGSCPSVEKKTLKQEMPPLKIKEMREKYLRH